MKAGSIGMRTLTECISWLWDLVLFEVPTDQTTKIESTFSDRTRYQYQYDFIGIWNVNRCFQTPNLIKMYGIIK